jgi:hypothetical protein
MHGREKKDMSRTRNWQDPAIVTQNNLQLLTCIDATHRTRESWRARVYVWFRNMSCLQISCQRSLPSSNTYVWMVQKTFQLFSLFSSIVLWMTWQRVPETQGPLFIACLGAGAGRLAIVFVYSIHQIPHVHLIFGAFWPLFLASTLQ